MLSLSLSLSLSSPALRCECVPHTAPQCLIVSSPLTVERVAVFSLSLSLSGFLCLSVGFRVVLVVSVFYFRFSPIFDLRPKQC